jgi:hypothetical protein
MKGMVCMQNRMGGPTVSQVPGHDVILIFRGNSQFAKETYHVIFMDCDVRNPQVVKEARSMSPVKSLQDEADHMTHIEDSSVNIKEDEQLMSGILSPSSLIMGCQFSHPALHHALPFH